MRWNKKFDGAKESLLDKSHSKLTPHPNSHTDIEIKQINNYLRRNPHIYVNYIASLDMRKVTLDMPLLYLDS